MAFISTQTEKVLYHGNKKGYHRYSNSSFSKSYWHTFFMKVDFFFTLLENSLKNLYKIQQLTLFLNKCKRYIITATKWAIIDFPTRVLQKVINKRFSWSSTFSSHFLKILWKFCIKASNWHLFLHKPKR